MAEVDAVVIWIAGDESAMRSARSLVLHEVGGLPMLAHVLATAEEIEPTATLAVVDDEQVQVQQWLTEHAPEIRRITPAEHDGVVAEYETVVTLPGNAPLLTPETALAGETDDEWELREIHTRVDLAEVHAEMNRRIVEHWMYEGVTVVDPASTWIDASVDLAPDVTLLPNVLLQGATSIATGAVIGPDTMLRDCEVGEDAVIQRAHAILSIIGPRATVGPYVSMRPDTTLGEGAHLGTFVETKKTTVGPGAKIPHLTYAGDGIVDEGANIGAGTIFANYDGANKSATHVGRYSFVGSNSVLVAPVDIADGAFVAAGSTITHDVAVGELAVARGRQHNASGWVEAHKQGTKTARAAAAATDEGTHPAVQASRDNIANKENDK